MYMVYIPVYSVYAIYTGVHVSIIMYIVYMPYTKETSQCGGKYVYGVYTCI